MLYDTGDTTAPNRRTHCLGRVRAICIITGSGKTETALCLFFLNSFGWFKNYPAKQEDDLNKCAIHTDNTIHQESPCQSCDPIIPQPSQLIQMHMDTHWTHKCTWILIGLISQSGQLCHAENTKLSHPVSAHHICYPANAVLQALRSKVILSFNFGALLLHLVPFLFDLFDSLAVCFVCCFGFLFLLGSYGASPPCVRQLITDVIRW